jgi:hypothetical protein
MWWASNNQRGLAAQLNAGKAPEWLQPVKIPGLHALKVYRVRKDLLAKA